MMLSEEWGIRVEGLISPEGEHLLLRNPVDLMVRPVPGPIAVNL